MRRSAWALLLVACGSGAWRAHAAGGPPGRSPTWPQAPAPKRPLAPAAAAFSDGPPVPLAFPPLGLSAVPVPVTWPSADWLTALGVPPPPSATLARPPRGKVADALHPASAPGQLAWEAQNGRHTNKRQEALAPAGASSAATVELRDLSGSWALDSDVPNHIHNDVLGFASDDLLASSEAGAGLVVVDVGASLGAAAISVAKRYPKALVIAIEPHPVIFRLLLWNLRANRVTSSVWPLNVAVGPGNSTRGCHGPGGPTPDQLLMRMVPEKSHRALQAGPDDCEQPGEGECYALPALSLPSILSRLGLRDVAVLKLNCEWCEYWVLGDPRMRELVEAGRVGRITGELHDPAQLRTPCPAEAVLALETMCVHIVWQGLSSSRFCTASARSGSQWSPQEGRCPEGYEVQDGIASEMACDSHSVVLGWCVLDPLRAFELCDTLAECCGVSETSNPQWATRNAFSYFVGSCPIVPSPEWRTCRRVAPPSTCPAPIRLQRAVAVLLEAAKGAHGREVRSWQPLVLPGVLTPQELAAVRRELTGTTVAWVRTQALRPDDEGLSRAREKMERLARDTYAAAKGGSAAGRLSCDDAVPSDGSLRSDRLMLEKPEGWARRPDKAPPNGPDGKWHGKDSTPPRVFDQGPAEAAHSGLGPAPRQMPCLTRLQEAVASLPVRTALAALAGLPVDSVRPLRLRAYRHTEWFHYSCPHTDESFDLVHDLRGSGATDSLRRVRSKWAARTLVSIAFNLGDEEAAEDLGGIVWCRPTPRRLPSPPGSAFIFRISNLSEHAILPEYGGLEGRQRMTVQVVFGGPLPGGGARPMGFLQPSDTLEALDSSAQGEPAAVAPECVDNDDVVRQVTLEQFGQALACPEIAVAADAQRLCAEGHPIAPSCCATCRAILALRAQALLELFPRQLAVEAMLREANARFRSPPLHAGVRGMPLLALGTGGLRGARAQEVVEYAIRSGYRHLDSAASYPSHVDGSLRQGVRRSGVSRAELFITTKVPAASMGFAPAQRLLLRLRGELPGGYADLCLVHWPRPEGAQEAAAELLVVERAGTWRALEEAQERGTCLAIGVSNYVVKHLEELSKYARVQPAVNQIEYAPGAPLDDVLDYCRRHSIVVEAFSWLHPHVLARPALVQVSEAVGKTPVQVLIRWFVSQGMVPLFKTEREERLLENAEALADDFALSDEQLRAISGAPLAEYPWSYYLGEAAPWNTPVMSTFQ